MTKILDGLLYVFAAIHLIQGSFFSETLAAETNHLIWAIVLYGVASIDPFKEDVK